MGGGTGTSSEVMNKPALMLPMGKDDFISGARWRFMTGLKPVLKKLGWTIGAELKGNDFGPWIGGFLDEARFYNARVTYHPPQSMTKKLHEGLADNLIEMANQVRAINKDRNIIEAVTIHCAPAISIDPPEDAGLERYNSLIGAEDMLKHIKAQVEPLKKLNELLGGVLFIENVDITNFREGGYRVPTYLQLQTGCWMDLLWLKEQAGVTTTLDSEHFFGADSLLNRRGYFSRLYSEGGDLSDAQKELFEISGYWLHKGIAPHAIMTDVGTFIQPLQPHLFHLGGSYQAFDEKNRIDTHLPDLHRYPYAYDALVYQLKYISEHPEVIGAVIEVTGQLDPEKYSEWSPRPADDELAKIKTYVTVVEEIEQLH